jgi:hypothetical protein
MTMHMVDHTVSTNDFSGFDHPELDAIVRAVLDGNIEEDMTIEQFASVSDVRPMADWKKARYVAENVACLWAAEHLIGWGHGYRSDDGYDYLTAAIDTVRFLTDIDLDEADFLLWWNCPADSGLLDGSPELVSSMRDSVMWGANDGEIRFMLFPKRSDIY